MVGQERVLVVQELAKDTLDIAIISGQTLSPDQGSVHIKYDRPEGSCHASPRATIPTRMTRLIRCIASTSGYIAGT